MEEEQKKTLCAQLGVVDDSLFFLLLIIAATLLSFWSVSLQRKGLCLTIQGETETAGQLPPIYPIRHKASAIIVGALGFFLCLALRTLEEAEEGGDGLLDLGVFAFTQAFFFQVDELGLDVPFFEIADGFLGIKALFRAENLDIHGIPPNE